MHSWVFRNRQHLLEVYAVAQDDAPLESGGLLPVRPPGHVVREGEDVILVPRASGGFPRRNSRASRRDAGTA